MFENLDMSTKDIIMTAAVILGPILAVQAQKFIERTQEKKNRRMALFKTLMSTRAERLNRDHVQALNMIDIEFYGRLLPFLKTRYQTRKEQAVTHAWKSYNSHLNQKDEYESLEQWIKKGDELFTNMLYAITQSLNYDYDKVQLQRDCYRPIAHGNIENTQLAILDGLDQLVNKGRPLPMYVVNFPPQEQADNNEQDIHNN
ncbi:MAG: hypothetical protein CMH22_01455 [Methylophaga sp.]|uniref:DUF6680 family protein n=1 Tax=Methylophaga sp. UBA678 TaxID=1946901 RepID=UPI000C35E997|nr:DUF6680 family protein [Methylophaga sp. UBA678]MAX50629.1 hypothetical protein [Methylophaga sp.]